MEAEALVETRNCLIWPSPL